MSKEGQPRLVERVIGFNNKVEVAVMAFAIATLNAALFLLSAGSYIGGKLIEGKLKKGRSRV